MKDKSSPANSVTGADAPAASRAVSLSERVRSLRLPDRPAGPTRPSRLPWALCAVLGISTVYLLARPREDGAPPDTGKPPPSIADGKRQPPKPGEVVLESKGYIMATHLYKVGPNQVGSKVIKLHPRFLEGQWIPRDTVLAELDNTEYQKKVDQAQGDYRAAQRDIEAAEARLKVARASLDEIQQTEEELEEASSLLNKLDLDFSRNQKLMDRKAVPAHDYEDVKFTYFAQRHKVQQLIHKLKVAKRTRPEAVKEAEANLEKARANEARAKGALEEAQWRLDNCVIKAPIPGTILKRYVERWDPLDARAFNLAAILCDMADLSDLEVELNIQEREIDRVEEGQKCIVHPETYPDKSFTGVVSRKMPNADRSKGAIPVRVKVLDIPNNNQEKYLVPDGGAIVTFLATPPEKRRELLRRLEEEDRKHRDADAPKQMARGSTR